MSHTPSAAPDPRPDDLVALATAHRVATEYWDWEGQQVTIAAATLRAVLTAIGVDASTSDEIRRSLATAASGPGTSASAIPGVGASLAVPECLVVREARAERFEVSGADSTKRPRPRVVAELEDGSTRDLESCGGATFVLPVDLPTGYHQLVARAEGVLSRGHLIVVPSRVPWPEALTDRRAWGCSPSCTPYGRPARGESATSPISVHSPSGRPRSTERTSSWSTLFMPPNRWRP